MFYVQVFTFEVRIDVYCLKKKKPDELYVVWYKLGNITKVLKIIFLYQLFSLRCSLVIIYSVYSWGQMFAHPCVVI